MLKFFNDNQGLMSAILSAIGLIFSGVAILISIAVARRQNKISLFEKKFETLKALEEYFTSLKGSPTAVSKFIYPRFKYESENVWDPEINKLIERATLLFSKRLSGDLLQIKDKYSQIRRLDGKISRFFSLLQEIPDYEEIELKFREYLENQSPSDDVENQFKELCRKFIFPEPDPFENDLNISIKYNFYELYNSQSEIFNSIIVLQNHILEAMKYEIKPQ